MDSRQYDNRSKSIRILVPQTTSANTLLARKDSLMQAMPGLASEGRVDQMLLFEIDILAGDSTLLVPKDPFKQVVEKSFYATVSGDTVSQPGLVSRKKQIISRLKV